MSVLRKLTEGIVSRDLKKEGVALLAKWERTGLLEGLGSDRDKAGMALMLENQAKELLREASAMSTGDVEGFAAVAFPIVRRVFGGLIANELVSVQPMSLPSGLIFFLDFTYTDSKSNAGALAGESLYGGNVVGQQITGGVDLTGLDAANDLWAVEKSAYSLNNAYASPTASAAVLLTAKAVRSGSGIWTMGGGLQNIGDQNYVNLGDALIQHDPDLSGSVIGVYGADKASFTNLDVDNLVAIHTLTGSTAEGVAMVRRLTRPDPLSASSGQILVVFATKAPAGGEDIATDVDLLDDADGTSPTFTYAIKDNLIAGGALGAVVGSTPWGLEGSPDTLAGQSGLNIDIPELDIKVDSISVTAQTKKLKAKWTPELGQDINAYHNLDAEVELTSILSEQIALEVDQEILNDLVKGATARLAFWSRRPGKFVNRDTGADLTSNGAGLPDFTGTVSEWYETLIETINDVSAQIHRKTLRGGANFLVCGPEVAAILEFTAGYRASITVDSDRGTAGAVNVGNVSKKWDVYLDPYFPRNLILVGRKGTSFLESGYVYAPYVPLQVTPTIFGTEDFVPRKGVMTRYAKKMVRPDHYGLVAVVDLLG